MFAGVNLRVTFNRFGKPYADMLSLQKLRFMMLTSLGSALRCVRLTPHVLSMLARRFMPARGSKPLPRYLWDVDDLIRQTKGEYTHEPLVLHRLGGRDPKTGLT